MLQKELLLKLTFKCMMEQGDFLKQFKSANKQNFKKANINSTSWFFLII